MRPSLDETFGFDARALQELGARFLDMREFADRFRRSLRFSPFQKETGRIFRSGRRLCQRSLFDQGMSPATNFGITGPPISAAKRLPSGVKK
ncbi:MAG: hypothetical protein ACR652_14980, partial [Methylocystis sp.]|uniref:hypothetical protein n=1 Tax=Methylocystis sp. TaxID=1911079 RepID=UPI003DA4FBC8